LTATPLIEAGIWEHWRGKRYLVLGCGRFDEDDDHVVIYVRLYERIEGGPAITVRRARDFLAQVTGSDGQRIPRFRFIGQVEPTADG
jgi:hypothetical protein